MAFYVEEGGGHHPSGGTCRIHGPDPAIVEAFERKTVLLSPEPHQDPIVRFDCPLNPIRAVIDVCDDQQVSIGIEIVPIGGHGHFHRAAKDLLDLRGRHIQIHAVFAHQPRGAEKGRNGRSPNVGEDRVGHDLS